VAYSAGAYVWQGGKLYRFTAAHPAGTWTGTDAAAVALGNDVSDLKSAVNAIQNTDNLFDASTTSEGRLDTTGKFASATGYFTSDYIPVTVGARYCKNSPVIDAYHRICAYATNTSARGRVISDSNYITIQNGENYVRFCGLAAEKDTAELYRVTAVDEVARALSANVPTLTTDVSNLKTAVGYGFKRTADLTDDLNTAGDGWTRATTAASNAPEPYGGFVMTASRADGSKVQIFITNDINHGIQPARIYIRYMYLGAWKAWATPEFDTFTNGTDYSGDLNSFDKGVARVSASATNNPTGSLGYVFCIKRAETARMQLFVTADGAIYARTQAAGTWGDWYFDAEEYFLSGKNGYTFGDSIMAQDGLAFSTHYTQNAQYNLDKLSQICKGYQSWLRQKYGVTITDYAVGGQGIVAQLPIIKAQDYTNVDFVIISTGTNDYSGARTMGTLPTSADAVLDETTFIGAYCSALKYIKTQKPEAKIILMTPLHRDTKWRNDGQPDFSKSATDIFTVNSKGLRLVDYRNAIIDIGELFSCVVCDMYANAGLNLYDLPTYTFEGVHPTNEGYAYIVPVLFRAFEKS
jgi:lysophospholipase L1-like esterase